MKKLVLIDPDKLQLKGNIHMHTTRSDGDLEPAEVASRYYEAGYHFLMISDHEIYWNSAELDRKDFLVLGGTETSIRMNGSHRWIIDYYRASLKNTCNQHKEMHYCCIKDESIPDAGQYFAHDEHVPRMLDRGIDSWNAQVNMMRERGNLVIINHPHWSRLNPELLLASQNITAFEVWNSGDAVTCGGRWDEDIWDWCLTRGKKLLAVAADDTHEATTDFAVGFTVVQAEEFTKAAICNAFKSGQFYASCGPLVKSMVIEDGVLKLECTPARHIQIVGYDRDGFDFRNVDKSLIDKIEWPIDTTMRYFRVVIIDAEGNRAWCQPVFIEELLDQGIL